MRNLVGDSCRHQFMSSRMTQLSPRSSSFPLMVQGQLLNLQSACYSENQEGESVVRCKEFSWKSHNLYLYINGHAYLQRSLGNLVFEPDAKIRVVLVKKSHRLTIFLCLSLSLSLHPLYFILYLGKIKLIKHLLYVRHLSQ